MNENDGTTRCTVRRRSGDSAMVGYRRFRTRRRCEGGDKRGDPAALGGGTYGNSAMVDALLKAGADGTAKNNNGKSPADLALETKHPMIVAKATPRLPRRRARS